MIPVDLGRTPLLWALSVTAFEQVIWPNVNAPDQTIEIQLDDLFSFLVEFWKPLLLRQTYPAGLTPERPSLLAADAAKRWANVPQDQADEEGSELDAFEEAHNLALAFGGMFDLPPLWLVRQGEQMLCDTNRNFIHLPFGKVHTELTRVGDEIAQHLRRTDEAKWSRIIEAWGCRDRASGVKLVSWSASLEDEVATKLIDQGLIDPPATFAEAVNDDDELLIAARVAGALPYEQIVQILDIARDFRHHRADGLDALSAKVSAYLRTFEVVEPHAQGETVAIFAREQLAIGSGERVDIFGLATKLGIDVRVDAIGPKTFDGLAIAGNRYGPGAFINRNGQRIREKGGSDLNNDAGARINLAHELCHLLIDRNHPLSAIEILRNRMPGNIESRARAFAGEFLLPSATAGKIWDEAGSPTDRYSLEAVLQRLADYFGVSFSVAAWKVEHGARWGLGQGGREQFRRLQAMLDSIASYR
ncbi:MAG: ImmA/IrrE family metallo-endopeptidase [Zavarzinia sp.]